MTAPKVLFILFAYGLLIACSHSSQYDKRASVNKTSTAISTQNKSDTGKKIAALAKSLVGSPYKYGGASPNGFDCSGLVYYTHGKFGIRTPRTSLQQFQRATRVNITKLTSGDLVFFKLSRNKVSHVGIYIGDGRFIHAPVSGKRVTMNKLTDRFWESQIVSGGRLY